MLTRTEIALIRASFDAARARDANLTLLFYDTLFQRYPDVRRLFPNDLAAQADKLAETLQLAVYSLADLSDLDDALAALGAAHAEKGVREEHYAAVADALLRTLDRLLPEFPPEARDAWSNLLAGISATMIAGARDASRQSVAAG